MGIIMHYPVKNVHRNMVQAGVMENVYGATINVWHKQVITTSFFNSIIIMKIHNTCITTINVSIAFPDYVPTDAPATGLDIPAVLYYDTQH